MQNHEPRTVTEELMDIVQEQIKQAENIRKLFEATQLIMQAVDLLRKEVQDGGQRSIKE
tara:strand:+ start:844 stop:1020 length:177 start_codon:yes stop_codon:yes gene_type:complete